MGVCGRVMVIRLDVEIWVNGKCGTKRRRKWYGSCWVLWYLSMFVCISVVVVEGVCVRDFRGVGLCTIGTVD
jgi:hypothetical protein